MIEYIAQYDYRDDEEIIVVTDELIRCKDCKFYDTPKNFKKPYCMRGAYVKVNADDYCSKGEKR